VVYFIVANVSGGNVGGSRSQIWFFLFIGCVCIGLHPINLLKFFKDVASIFKRFFFGRLFFRMSQFVFFSSKTSGLFNLQFERSKFPHIAADVELAALTTFI